MNAAEVIKAGSAVLGIELGSTRIKAALIAPDTTPLAGSSHAWENQLKDGVWTYDIDEVWPISPTLRDQSDESTRTVPVTVLGT